MDTTEENKQTTYAGFWLIAVALIIDHFVMSIAIFPIILLIGLAAPKMIVVSTPLGLFETTEIIESKEEKTENTDGSVTVILNEIKKRTVLNTWTYHYKTQSRLNDGETSRQSAQLIDPDTKRPIKKTKTDNLILLALLIYWPFMEASKYQASLGKMILGIKVTNAQGGRQSPPQAFARNLLKFFSMATAFIGFMMAGWTKNKQALHDMISKSYVIKANAKEPQS